MHVFRFLVIIYKILECQLVFLIQVCEKPALSSVLATVDDAFGTNFCWFYSSVDCEIVFYGKYNWKQVVLMFISILIITGMWCLSAFDDYFSDCDHPLTRLMYGYQKSVCQRALDATNLAISSPQASTPLSSSTGFSYDPNLNTTCSASSQMDAVSLRNDKSGSIGSSSKHGLEQITATLVSDVQAYLEKLETMFVVMYEDFDDEEIRYTLRDLLEDIFFQPIWSFILSLFRSVLHSFLKVI